MTQLTHIWQRLQITLAYLLTTCAGILKTKKSPPHKAMGLANLPKRKQLFLNGSVLCLKKSVEQS